MAAQPKAGIKRKAPDGDIGDSRVDSTRNRERQKSMTAALGGFSVHGPAVGTPAANAAAGSPWRAEDDNADEFGCQDCVDDLSSVMVRYSGPVYRGDRYPKGDF